jgi:hypothetical protein
MANSHPSIKLFILEKTLQSAQLPLGPTDLDGVLMKKGNPCRIVSPIFQSAKSLQQYL